MSKATYTYGLDATAYDFTDKPMAIDNYVKMMFARTNRMFEYENLPSTIPERMLELYLQVNGNVCIAAVNGELYAFTGGLGGEPDAYYMPTVYTVANPALNYSKNLKINEECIVIPNDSSYLGIMPLARKYATALCENDISLKLASINSRIQSLVSADDDSSKMSAEEYFRKIEKGELGVIANNAFLEGIKAQPYSTASAGGLITNLIEYTQYLKASWFNELGLNANYNMKREAINTSEAQMNDDALMPFVDDMLHQREIGIDKVNDMFGTNIKVKKSSAWEDNQIELDQLMDPEEIEEKEVEENEEDSRTE